MNSHILKTGGLKSVIVKKESMGSFYIVILYLFLEFGRPQNIVPGLGSLHLPAITLLLMMISLAFSGKIYLKNTQTVVFILIMLEMIIHGPIASNNYWAFWVFYGMAINFIAFLGISHIVDSNIKYFRMMDYYLLIFVFLAVHGIIKHGRGVGGFLGDENDFCLALNMVLPFAIYSILSAESLSGRIYYIFLSGLFLLANVTTLSRGGFLGLACVVGYCVVRSKNKIAIASLMTVLVFFIMLFAPSTYWDEVRSIFGEPTNPQGTGAQRIYAWKLGWEMFLDHPILGVGQGNYPWHVVGIENELGMQWQERSLGGRAAHSLYFTLLPELGLIGTFLYVMLIFYFLKDIKYIKNISKISKGIFSPLESKKHMNQAFACEASLIGFLVSSIFISTLYYPPFYILCGFVLSYKKILQAKVSESKSTGQAMDKSITLIKA